MKMWVNVTQKRLFPAQGGKVHTTPPASWVKTLTWLTKMLISNCVNSFSISTVSYGLDCFHKKFHGLWIPPNFLWKLDRKLRHSVTAYKRKHVRFSSVMYSCNLLLKPKGIKLNRDRVQDSIPNLFLCLFPAEFIGEVWGSGERFLRCCRWDCLLIWGCPISLERSGDG